MTTPPFPYGRNVVNEPVGMPIVFDRVSDDERRHLHYGEVGLEEWPACHEWRLMAGQWWSPVPARTVIEARDRANQLADRVIIPNARYRRDIGDRLASGDLERVINLGLLDEP